MAENVPQDECVSDDFVIDVVEALEASSLDSAQYRLHDRLDVEALERLVESCDDVTVRVIVENTMLAVSDGDVRVIETE